MGRYIALPVPRDPAEAEETSFEVVRTQFPQWAPRDADPLTIALRSNAVLVAELGELATRMGEEAFRFFGRGVAELPPVDARPAVGRLLVTAKDDDGPYLVPEGMQVLGRSALGEEVGFRTLAAAVIPSGASTVTVDVEATDEGVESNGIGGSAEFSEYIDYLTAVEFVGVTSGGEDREADAPYLDRLSDEFEMFSPRPILPEHFATLARRLGAYRATAIDGLDPLAVSGQNERQSVTMTGASSGSFGLRIMDPESPVDELGTLLFDFTDSADEVQTAVGMVVSDVVVTGGPLTVAPLVFEWAGSHAGEPWPLLVAVNVTPSGADVDVARLQAGEPFEVSTGNRATVAVAMIDAAGEPLPPAERSRIGAALLAMREVGWSVPMLDPTYTGIDVAWTATAYPGWDPAVVNAAAAAQVAAYLSPATWGARTDTGEVREWLNEPLVRYLEVAEQLQRVEGLRYLNSLTIARSGQTPRTVNVTLDGLAPLPRPGVIGGTVAAG